jgi:hypothetical protein
LQTINCSRRTPPGTTIKSFLPIMDTYCHSAAWWEGMGLFLLKFEARSTKSETNSKHETPMTETLSQVDGSRLEFRISVIRACFGFRNWNFVLSAPVAGFCGC